MSNAPLFNFDNSYARLSDSFYALVPPTPSMSPELIQFNQALAESLGLDFSTLSSEDMALIFGGNTIPEDAEPLAMAYAGHQFGNLNPQLGDGRAVLLGETIGKDGLRYDIQLKGPGRTPFSRSGDGRAALGPILREYLLSEAMAVLNVPTTRALAAVTSGEFILRERMVPGAIITRVSRSFVRVGTFQFFAIRDNPEALKELADYVIARNYPELEGHDAPYLALLNAVIKRQASLIARWMQLGFIHGVMNTDNMSIAGETIDYGPCAFIDDYHPEKVFSSIDREGRYAYQNQPAAGHWDLCRLAEALMPLLHEDREEAAKLAQTAINEFPPLYTAYWLTGMCHKLGLTAVQDGDKELVEDLLNRMARNKADFTLTFRHLSDALSNSNERDQPIRDLFTNTADFDGWAVKWRERLMQETRNNTERQQAMYAVNPLYIPRNHLVEAVIRAAEDNQDFGPFYELLAVLEQPYAQQDNREQYALPPKPGQEVLRTFCGT